MLAIEDIKQVYRIEANASDLADAVSWDTFLLFSNSPSIPASMIRKICHDEFGVDYVNQMGGYAVMRKYNPFRENMLLSSYSVKEIYDARKCKRNIGQDFVKRVSAGAVVDYEPATNEYLVDRLEKPQKELDQVIGHYKSGASRRQSQDQIRQAKEALEALSEKGRSALIASLLGDRK